MFEELREELAELNENRLAHLAYKAIRRGLKPDDFVVVCIDVDDPYWKDLVDSLMPNYDWQSIRDRGLTPIARGIVDRDYILAVIKLTIPSLVPAFNQRLPRGTVFLVVLAYGATVFHLRPARDLHIND